LGRHKRELTTQVDRLVNALAEGGAEIKSVGSKLVELEEQRESLCQESERVALEKGQVERRIADAGRLKDRLCGFEDIYKAATPAQQKELLKLQLNQIIWKPQESSLEMELFDYPSEPVLTDPGLVRSVVSSGSGGRARTCDNLINSQTLCQLSYAGIPLINNSQLYKRPVRGSRSKSKLLAPIQLSAYYGVGPSESFESGYPA
jgi:hypothetical protein